MLRQQTQHAFSIDYKNPAIAIILIISQLHTANL